MSIATVVEMIAQERSIGSSDDAIAALLRASNIEPPAGHYRWTRVAVRAAMTEEPDGREPDGTPRSGSMR
jgi:hypothetical protein